MADAGKVKPVHLHWDGKQCTGCMSCVVVCSERHIGASWPARSRIKVLVDPLGGSPKADYCRQCRNAACAAACPEEAIRFRAGLRAWVVDEDACTGCGRCVDACRFAAMRLDPLTGRATKCDLCLGAAYCVEVCPAGALSLKGQEVSPDG